MGKKATLGGDGRLYKGEDKDVVIEVLDRDGATVDVSGWSTLLVITATLTSAGIVSVAGTVSGSYSATRALNTQRITFPLTDDNTDLLTAGNYIYSIKRTNTGSERILLEGPCIVETTNQ